MPIHFSEINEPFEYYVTSDIVYKLKGRNPKTPLELESELIDLIHHSVHPIKYIGFIKQEKWKSTLSTVVYEYCDKTYITVYSNLRKFIKDILWKPNNKSVSNYKVQYDLNQFQMKTGYDITVHSLNASKTKITFTCNKHCTPYSWSTIFKNIKNTSCARCAGVAALPNSEIKERVLRICNEKEYTLENISYNKTLSTINVKCNNGHSWCVGFRNFTHAKTNCPICNSKDSYKISEIDEIFKNAEKEKRFNECRNIKPLPFDRYIEEYNLLIEFDGVQHFDENNSWHSTDTLIRDNIKTEFAINNNYNFLRISYKHNVKDVILSYLELLNENPNSQVIQIYDKITIK